MPRLVKGAGENCPDLARTAWYYYLHSLSCGKSIGAPPILVCGAPLVAELPAGKDGRRSQGYATERNGIRPAASGSLTIVQPSGSTGGGA